MVFILLFVLVTLAIPLSLEIYKRGNDNLLKRSLEDIQDIVPSLGIGKVVSGVADILRGFFLIVVAIAALLLALKIVLAILSLIFGWIVS